MIFEFEGLLFGIVLPLIVVEHVFKRVFYGKALIQNLGGRRSNYYWNGVVIGLIIDVVFIVYVYLGFSRYTAIVKNWF